MQTTRRVRQRKTPSDSSSTRGHPYRRPAYFEEDPQNELRVDDDALLQIIQDARRNREEQAPVAPGAEDAEEEKGDDVARLGNNKFFVGAILLLECIVAIFFFGKQLLFMGILIRRGQPENHE